MRVLFVTAELFPWVKTGGLGDVAAALPPALAEAGTDVRFLIPGFAGYLDAFPGVADVVRLRTPFAAERVRVAKTTLPGSSLVAYIVDLPSLFDRPGSPYAGPDGRDWPDNERRFALFSWVAAALARGADPGWKPDLLHGHDWHAGLAPAYLAATPDDRVPVVFTVHNLAYQGFFPAHTFGELALPWEFWSTWGVEFYGQVSFMKAGLYYADRLTTVSPTYAREIQTPAFGCGLDGLLRDRASHLSGILNGVDPRIWDPATDPVLPRHFEVDNPLPGKRDCAAELCRRLGLAESDGPILGIVSRLTPQKGLDLLLDALPGIVEAGGRLALLGSGDGWLESGFGAAQQAHPGRVGIMLGYDEALSHLIIAGSDLVLVPSRFEPCGLTQLYGLRYGTLPLVRRVGGLADTVADATEAALADGSATGFAFDGESGGALLDAFHRALQLFRYRPAWSRMMRQAMTRDFSWAPAAEAYTALYASLA